MAIILDIIGSLAIRGAIMLTILQLNVSLQQTMMFRTATANVRANLATMLTIIENDVRQAGYGVSGSVFLESDTSSVKFCADMANDGSVDTVSIYRSGDEVYRKVNSETPLRIGIGVTQLKFMYYTSAWATTTSPGDVQSVKWSASMEENYTIGGDEANRPSAQSEFQVYPENL